MPLYDFEGFTDEALLARMEELAHVERKNLPYLLACLAAVDQRNAHQKPGFPSLFAYCTQRLRYSEDEAYRRIQACRAAARFNEIYSLLADGSLSLTAVSKLAPHLTTENAAELLDRAQGRSKRELEALLAALAPLPDIPDRIRILKAAARAPTAPPVQAAETGPEPPPACPCFPFGPEIPREPPPQRYAFAFSGSKELNDAIDRLKDVLWTKYPLGRLEEILLEVLNEYLLRHDPQLRLSVTSRRRSGPKEKNRRVPAHVRAAVWKRDAGRCAYVAQDGRRCQARRGLELDHILPFALGGRSDDARNIRLLCRAHNDCERRRILGESASAQERLG